MIVVVDNIEYKVKPSQLNRWGTKCIRCAKNIAPGEGRIFRGTNERLRYVHFTCTKDHGVLRGREPKQTTIC